MEYASWNFATLYLIGLVQSNPESSPDFPTGQPTLSWYKLSNTKLQFFKQLINFLINDTLA